MIEGARSTLTSVIGGGLPSEDGGHDPGEDREDEDDADERERGAPRPRPGRPGTPGVAFLKICTDSAVFAPSNRLVFVVVHEADREEQRRGLARGAGDREQRAADDPGRRGRAARPARSCRPCRPPSAYADSRSSRGHEPQHLVAGADHDRQHQAAERERTRERRLAVGQHPRACRRRCPSRSTARRS